MLCHSLHLSVFASAEVFYTNHKGHRQKNSALIIVSLVVGLGFCCQRNMTVSSLSFSERTLGGFKVCSTVIDQSHFLDRNTVRKERECVFLTFSTNMDVCF